MMTTDEVAVRPGETAAFTLSNGVTVELVGDGRVDPLIERGADRPRDYVSAIAAPRVEIFLRTEDPAQLGGSWSVTERESGRQDRTTRLIAALPGGAQQIVVDYSRRSVQLHTPYPSTVARNAVHAIEAKFDARTREIRVRTIREFVLEEG